MMTTLKSRFSYAQKVSTGDVRKRECATPCGVDKGHGSVVEGTLKMGGAACECAFFFASVQFTDVECD